MSRYYYSIYGPLIKQFIDDKRTFGYKYAMVEQECARFDRFAYDNDEKVIGISKDLAIQWCAKKPNESVKTRRNRVQIIRVFSAYLCSVCALHEQCTHHRRSVKMSNLQILLKIPIVRG